MLNLFRKKIANTHEKQTFISNVFFLGLLQVANYVFPLITIPYLVRVLGPEYYGLLAFSAATVAYFSLVTDYGFNLTAVPQISVNQKDNKKLTEIYSAIISVKVILLVFSFVLLSLLLFSFDKFRQHWALYYITFLSVFANIFVPTWLYQGLQVMKYITFQSVLTKLFFTLAIFVFVKEESDFLLVPLITALGALVSGFWSQYFITSKFGIKFKFSDIQTIKYQFKDGWHVFYSTIAISLYTVSATFILGLFASNTVVGYFAAADKVIQASRGLYIPISRSLSPVIAKKLNKDYLTGMVFVKKVLIGSAFYNLVISVLVFLFADRIVDIILGGLYQQAVHLLKVMSFLPFIIGLSNMLGIQIMLNLNLKRELSLLITVAAGIGLILNFLLVPTHQSIATAWVLVAVEIMVTVAMFLVLFKKKIL